MGTELNWSLAGRMPDYASGTINAFRAGREDRKARVEENAFAKYGQDPDGAIDELMRVNPDAAIKLQDRAAAQQAQARREGAYQTAAGGDFKAARAQGGADLDLQSAIDKMQDGEIKASEDRANKLGAVLWDMRHNIPQEQWSAHIQKMTPALGASGITPDTLGQIDLTPTSLDGYIAQAMSMKEMIDTSIKKRQLEQGDARIAETGRHNRAAEGVSAAQLGVSRSNSARGWASHNARQRAGGYGTPGAGGYVADENVEIDP